uniref:Uncharacterized protein n=1 Tax=Oryza brachyantha TaxID=4533 RepID=J3LNA3_ORYBR
MGLDEPSILHDIDGNKPLKSKSCREIRVIEVEHNPPKGAREEGKFYSQVTRTVNSRWRRTRSP